LQRYTKEVFSTILLLSKLSHFHLMSWIFKPSARLEIVIYIWICNQIRANIQVVHFAKPKNLEPNAFNKSPEIRQFAKPKHFSQTHSKFARIPESGDKFANLATLSSLVCYRKKRRGRPKTRRRDYTSNFLLLGLPLAWRIVGGC